MIRSGRVSSVVLGAAAFVVLEIVALVIGFAVVGHHGGGPIQGWDDTVERWFSHHQAHFVATSRVIADVCDPPILGAISAALSLGLLALGQRKRSLVPIVAYLGAEALVLITWQVITRPPPTAGYVPHRTIGGLTWSGYSYPSGHATAGAAVLLSLAVLAIATWRRRGWVIASVLVLVSLAVGCSRLVLGVHWFSDVAVGLVLGAAWGITVAVLAVLAVKDRQHPARRAPS